MNRILLGAAIGAALVYFFDVERGEDRRRRTADWGRQYINSDTLSQARQATQQATQSTVRQARALTGQVSDSVNQLRSRRSSDTTPSYESADSAAIPQI